MLLEDFCKTALIHMDLPKESAVNAHMNHEVKIYAVIICGIKYTIE